MHLLVGLGNPGSRYAGNRHNIGFMALDRIAERHGFQPWRKRFQGLAAEGRIAGESVLALKPQTFMNNSGRSVGEAGRFFKLPPEALWVFYDELDLAPGRIRVKRGGGAGGHNGIRSIDSHYVKDYWRVRLGIGHPGDKAKVMGHVLSDFAKAETWLAPFLDAVAGEVGTLLTQGHEAFMSRVSHLAPAPQSKPARKPAANPENGPRVITIL
ncbi:MAG: aminoacyl-tRNA hydrolase [Pseudomonadota bacterium]